MNPLKSILPKGTMAKDVVFLCIGTDRSTGDALGPLVGTALKKKGYNVIGTINDPVHAVNLKEIIDQMPKGKIVIAIDACLGKLSSVGTIKYKVGSIKPGAGVGKSLPSVGDYSMVGIVNVGGFMEYFVLQNTKLSMVMRMADEITAVISTALPRKKRRKSKTLSIVDELASLDKVAATVEEAVK